MRVRFSRWSGTQEVFPVTLAADEVLEELGDDLLGGRSLDGALRGLLARGVPGRLAGLDDLRSRVEEARHRELARMGLEGPLQPVAEELAGILDRERAAVEAAGAEGRRERLDDLPDDLAARLHALERYQWLDVSAGADFAALMERLRRDVAAATFGRLAGALGSVSPAALERMRDLLAELNDLADRHQRGEDVSADFAGFKERFADLLPADVGTIDELLAELARRMAAMSRLLAGMDPQQRAELGRLAEQLLADLDLSFQADRLRRWLERAFPELGWDQGVPGVLPGGEPAGLADTVDWVEHLQSFEDLAAAMAQDYPGARLEDIDEAELRRLVGEDAARALRGLLEIERTLEEAGAARRRGGRLELTPRGIRRLGERSLARIYERAVSGAGGSHASRAHGGDGELTGTTRRYRFGDPFRLDVPRTVANAVRRGGGRAAGLDLDPGDFELAEAEHRVRTATVLLLDMSFSMPLRGNWVPAKRVALALSSLVSAKFPEDRFYVVGFSDYARRLQAADLLATGWERVYGTNMQHAFILARRLLASQPAADQQVIMITDGEPTAHLEGDQAWFAWPPEAKTLKLTLVEASRLARTGATLNVFLLDHDPGAAAFVEQMVSGYGGRIFYPDPEQLGRLVVRDFLRARR